MLPPYGFDWPPVPDNIEVPLRKGRTKKDYAWGALEIGVVGTVLRESLWEFRASGRTIYGTRPGKDEIEIFTAEEDFTEFAVAFDTNMYPVIAMRYTAGDKRCVCRFMTDPAQQTYATIYLPAEAHTPRVAYDLKHVDHRDKAEAILAYMVGKDIFVMTESNKFNSARLAASYIQQMYIDQLSFAANNRMRFIMYQLTHPDDLPESDPIPQSKYSSFLYRAPYKSGGHPQLPEKDFLFSSVGLKYVLQVNETAQDALVKKVFTLSLALRPEWIDEIVTTGKQNTAILEITTALSTGSNTKQTRTLTQLLAGGALAFDPIIKMYRFTFNHVTSGTGTLETAIIIKDMVVGERTVFNIDEKIKLPS